MPLAELINTRANVRRRIETCQRLFKSIEAHLLQLDTDLLQILQKSARGQTRNQSPMLLIQFTGKPRSRLYELQCFHGVYCSICVLRKKNILNALCESGGRPPCLNTQWYKTIPVYRLWPRGRKKTGKSIPCKLVIDVNIQTGRQRWNSASYWTNQT